MRGWHLHQLHGAGKLQQRDGLLRRLWWGDVSELHQLQLLHLRWNEVLQQSPVSPLMVSRKAVQEFLRRSCD